MPLNDYTSIYKGEKALIVSQEKGRRHVGINSDLCTVTHYRIDGVIFTNETACDYILLNEDKGTAYLIELKGRKTDKAAEQLKATEEKLRQYLKNYKLHFRIVSSKSSTHNINSAAFRKIQAELCKRGDLKLQSNELEENI